MVTNNTLYIAGILCVAVVLAAFLAGCATPSTNNRLSNHGTNWGEGSIDAIDVGRPESVIADDPVDTFGTPGF